MKCYYINVKLIGTNRIEDPKCPAYWRRSGCFDIDIDAEQIASVSVLAESEEAAKEYALGYPYFTLDEFAMEYLNDVKISEVVLEQEVETDEEPGVFDVVFGDADVDNYESDPDEYYERERIEEYERGKED